MFRFLMIMVVSVATTLSVSNAQADGGDIELIAYQDAQVARVSALEAELSDMRAELVSYSSYGGFNNSSCGDSCNSCCDRSGCDVAYELMALKYARSDGHRVGDGGDENGHSDWNLGSRLTVGYRRCDGLGVRVRWSDYNHLNDVVPQNGDNSFVSIDNTVIDLEFYDDIMLGSCWSLETSGGVRYNDFREHLFNGGGAGENRISDFEGWGGVAGLEIRRRFGCSCELFTRFRGSILVDDQYIFNRDNPGGGGAINTTEATLLDTIHSVAELAVGFRYQRCLSCGTLDLSLAAEWQQYMNYSLAFNDVGENAPISGGDAGFAGIVVGVGISR